MPEFITGLQVEGGRTRRRQAGTSTEFGAPREEQTLEDFYESSVLPEERKRLDLALAQLRASFGQQAAASRGRNIDLSRRLGLGTGPSSGLQTALSSSLSQALANSLARRRASFGEEIQGFRAAELGRFQQQRVADVKRRQAANEQFSSALGAGVGAIPYVGGLLQGLGTLAVQPTSAAFGEDIGRFQGEEAGFQGQEFGTQGQAFSSAPSGAVDLSQLGARLAQGQGGQVLLPEDEEARRRRLLGLA